MDESMQATKSQPPTEVVLMDTNKVLLFRNKRVLTWDEWMELMSHHDENRCAFPSEKLLAYSGQIVAWEPDGSAIHESGSTYGEVVDKIKAQGDDPQIYPFENIEDFSGTAGAGDEPEEQPLNQPFSSRVQAEGGKTVDDSVQATSDQPLAEAASSATNGAPAVRKPRVLTWDERMELMSHYGDNRCNFPSEQLLLLVGKTIAWELDGSAIRETGSDYGEVSDKIRAQGDDPLLYHYEDIPII